MAIELGSAYVSILPSMKGFREAIAREMKSDIDKVTGDAGESAGRSFVGRFKLPLAGIATVVGGAFAAVAVGGFLKDSIAEASDLGESMSKVNVVFGDMAPTIQEFAKTAATSIGQSTQQALEATGTFGNLFRAIGLSTPVAADMSTKIVTLAGDLASFNNASPEDVLLALRAGLVGETEPLRVFGVNLNEARLKAEALRLGLVKGEVDQKKFSTAQEAVEKSSRKVAEALKKYGTNSTQYTDAVRDQEQATATLAEVLEGKVPATLDAATKAQASYSLIMQDTSLAQGDFARTSDGLANKSRIVAAQFTDLKAKIGAALLPAVLAVTTAISNRLLPGIEGLGRIVGPIFRDLAAGATAFVQSLLNSGAFDAAAEGIKSFVNALRTGTTEDEGTPIERVALGIRGAFEKLREIDIAALIQRITDAVAPLVPKLVEFGAAAVELGGKIAAFVIDNIPTAVAAFETLMTVVRPVVDAIVAGVSLLADNFDTLKPVIIAVVAAFATFKTVQGVNTTIAGTVTKFNTLKSTLSNTKGEFTKLGSSIKTGATTLAGWAKTAGTAVVSAAKSVASAVASAATSLYASAQAALVAAANWVKNTAVMIAHKTAALATAVATKAMAAAQWLLNAAMTANPIGLIIAGIVALAAGLVLAYQKSETFRAIIDAIGRVIMTVVKVAVDWLVNTAVPAIVGFATSVYNAVSGVVQFFVDLPGKILGALGDAASWLYQKGQDIISGLLEGIKFYFELVKAFYIDMPLAILRFIGDVAKTLYDKGRDLINGFLEGLKWVWDTSVRGFFAFRETILGIIGDVAGWLYDKGVQLITGFLQGITWYWDNVLKPAINLGQRVLDGIGNLGSTLYNAGWDLIQGFINGIIGAAPRILSTIRNEVTDKIPGWIKGPLGIGSPSKLTMQYGEWVAEGLALGVKAGAPGIERQMSNLTDLVNINQFDPTRLRVGVGSSFDVARASSVGPAPTVNQTFNGARMSPREVGAEVAWALRTAGR